LFLRGFSLLARTGGNISDVKNTFSFQPRLLTFCRRRSTSTHRDGSDVEHQDDDVGCKRSRDRDVISHQLPDKSRHNDRQDNDNRLDRIKNRRDDRHRDDRRYDKQERDDIDRSGRNDGRHRIVKRERDSETEEDDRHERPERRRERSQKG
jgi:hypothetical protein